MNLTKKAWIGALLAAALTTSACAFSKTTTYTPGQFSDVPANEWYAAEVASTYELGLMNGVGGGLFEPEGNVTVAEAVTMAARAAAIHAGDTIDTASAGEWYAPYVNYAVAKGFVKEGDFDSYDRPAARHEVASLFENAMPAGYFAAKNNIASIPDVSEKQAYHSELLALYRAGVVMGSDSYGNFFPENNITRAEAAAIIARVALPEKRLVKELDVLSGDDAYLLVTGRNSSLRSEAGDGVKSGWLYDGRGGAPMTSLAGAYSSLVDTSTEHGTAFIREFNKTTTGRVVLQTGVTLGNDSYEGAYLEYRNDTGDSVYRLKAVDGAWQVLKADGTYHKLCDIGAERSFAVHVVVDLDNHRSTTYLNGTDYGTYALSVSPEKTNLLNFRFATDETGTAMLTPGTIKMTVNYGVYELFDFGRSARYYGGDDAVELPVGWNGSQGAQMSGSSLKLPAGAFASTQFLPVSGKVVAEFIVLQPKGEAVSYELKSGEKVVARFTADADNYSVNGVRVYENYVHNLWYRFRFELDTDAETILVKVNGRRTAEVPFAAAATSVDNLTVTNGASSDVFFDTFKVFRTVEREDYVPKPIVPAGEDKYTVGMNVCSLWVNELHGGWGCISPHDDLEPVLGFYDEGNPETADWEIKYLVEHGIDFQAFCIYFNTTNGVLNIDNERTHLYNAFMNAKYSDMTKFAMLWEAGNAQSPDSMESWKKNYVPYFIENFFKDDRYMTIDNRLVLCVFGWQNLSKRIGGDDKVKEMFDYLEEEVKKLGYDGMLYLASDAAGKQMEAMGFDGSYAYNWGTSGYSLDHNMNSILNSAKYTGMYTVPTISVGFNNIGWSNNEHRWPMMTVSDYAAAQKWVKEEYLPTYAKEDWQKNFVMLSTWNEYGEGTYIMPTADERGFGYLDALREAYTDEKADAALNTVPTAAQKVRINRMYPQYRHLLRRDGFVTDTSSAEDLEVAALIDFTKDDGGFNVGNIENIEFTQNGAVGVSGGDALINRELSCEYTLDRVPAIRITMQSAKGEGAQLFFMTASDTAPSESKSFKFLSASDEMTEYIIPTTGNKSWAGSITKIRLDPVDGAGKTFTVKSVELLAETDMIPKNMFIDGQKTDNFFPPCASEKGDMLVAFDPRQAIDYRLGIFHEWDKENGVLTLNMREHTLVYTVGSSGYLLDGAEKDLGYPLPSIDGLPYLPIEKFCADVGYSYKLNDDNIIEVETDSKWYYDQIKDRKPGVWNFNLPGDTEGWYSSFMSLAVNSDGFMEAASMSDSNDPTILSEELALSAAKYSKLEIRVKYTWDKDPHNRPDQDMVMYFITNTDTAWSESKTLRAKLKGTAENGKSSHGEWEEYVIDTSSCPDWKDTVTKLRFDPFNATGTMEIDYIRFVEG